MIIAVDFDGTITKDNTYPHIKELNHELIASLKELKSQGHKLILWTCRCDEFLDDAVKVCSNNGLTFDAINDNIEEHIAKFNNNCRKVYADIYIDDKNSLIDDFITGKGNIYK